MPKRLFASLTAVLWLFLAGISVAQAQSPGEPQVLGVVAQPGAESLGLDVYFVMKDAQGQPVLDPNLEGATIEVLGGASAPVPASVEDPQSDIYVVLLLDTSGSMQNTIGQVREAALSALKNLPDNARVSVITFDDRTTPITDFTGDLDEVQNRIRRVQAEPGAATCLYDAVWNAIDRLELAAKPPQDRRALILFTDGKDQRSANSSDPCSIHTLEDTILKAQRQPATPVHTIGLCGANCSNINSKELGEMSSATLGFSAIGVQTELGSMFQTIMDGLNAQLVAHADVFAGQGLGQAVLTVKLRDRGESVTMPFGFMSDRNYNAPLPPVGVSIGPLVYNDKANTYALPLTIDNPQSVIKLILNVEETDGGKTVPSLQNLEININGRQNLSTDFDASELVADKKYTINIQAVDKNGFLVERKSDISSSSRDDPTLLARKEFTHTPLQPKGVEFTIESVNPDYQAEQLVVDLALAETGEELIYQGFIKDNESGQKIAEYDRKIFVGNQIVLPIPRSIVENCGTPLEYQLDLTLETKGDKPQQTNATFDFKPARPPCPGPLERIWRALQDNPIFLVAIFAFIAAILAYRYYQGRQTQKRRDEVRRPPVSRTTMVSPEIPQMRLKLRVLTTPGQAPVREAVITQFPYIIGRKEGNFTLPDDPHMSGKHAKITARGNEFFIEDLDSKNHTYLGSGKLEPDKPVRLKGVTRVRFGPDTEVEIETI